MVFKIVRIFMLVFILSGDLYSQYDASTWIELTRNISVGFFRPPSHSGSTISPIVILRSNAVRLGVDFYCSTQFEGRSRTMQDWAETFELLVVTNAGMFGKDLSTSVGYLKSGAHYNNSQLNSRHKAVLACGPLFAGIPPIQIIDMTCQDFSGWGKKYNSYLQGIRMISCLQKNVWQPQEQRWPLTAAAVDTSGNLLLIHSGAAYTVHEFINILLELPIHIFNAMYLEGGAQAGLYVSQHLIPPGVRSHPDIQKLTTAYFPRNWKVPNVIGLKEPENYQR